MSNTFPDDADGQALRRVLDNGSDMSKPMVIDFQLAVPSEQAGNDLAEAARKLGYRAHVYDTPGYDQAWTCECSTRMLATYDGVIAIQEELGQLAAPFGGVPDGWGTFGNGPSGQPPALS